ncbi:MAG: uracil phosphoribosyltransferase [Candidatus Kapabacteria bacterium]|nr:uracil phosphoribosyltransferase [Candidatus Kapabacteria bacterium]
MAIVLSGTALSAEIATIRDRSSTIDVFRSAVYRIGLHLAVETSRHLPSREIHVTTPIETTVGEVIDGNVIVVPILRAGLGLLDPFLKICPNVTVGFIGLKRNEETLKPTEYYRNLPPSDSSTTFIVIDPMLATGGSMTATLALIRELPHRKIIAACLISAPEGIGRIAQDHPDVLIITAALDRQLNNDGYIVPGLGDAGDRLFGTL